jgi:hypothetical protein
MLGELSKVLLCHATPLHIQHHLNNTRLLIAKITAKQNEVLSLPIIPLVINEKEEVINVPDPRLVSVRTSMDEQDIAIIQGAPRISKYLTKIFHEVVKKRQQVVIEFEKGRQRTRMTDQRKAHREVMKQYYNWYKKLIDETFVSIFQDADPLLEEFKSRIGPNFSIQEIEALSLLLQNLSKQYFLTADNKPSKECFLSKPRHKQLVKRIEDKRTFYLCHIQLMNLYKGKRDPTPDELKMTISELQAAVDEQTKTKSSRHAIWKKISRYSTAV